MKAILILIIPILTSCGKTEDTTGAVRCFSREEAINACMIKEMASTGVTSSYARQLCLPDYPYENCYDLNKELNR